MDNRRQHYRHVFGAGAFPVECLLVAGKYSAEVFDLSVGGIGLRPTEPFPPLVPGQRLQVRFCLRPGMMLSLLAEAIYQTRDLDPRVGLRFLPLDDPVAEESRDRTLWAFLLEEQRKKRRLELADSA